MNIYIDIDDTICRTPPNRDYSKAKPILENIALANQLYDEGHQITYWTARGGVSGIDWTKVTEKQLKKWGAKHHALKLTKPAYDLFIDDKVLNARVWEKRGNKVAMRVILQQFQKDKDNDEKEDEQSGDRHDGPA